jgi:hypothetical protein
MDTKEYIGEAIFFIMKMKNEDANFIIADIVKKNEKRAKGNGALLFFSHCYHGPLILPAGFRIAVQFNQGQKMGSGVLFLVTCHTCDACDQ